MSTVNISITFFLFTILFIFFSFMKKDNSLVIWLIIAILITISLGFVKNTNNVHYAQ